MIDQLTIEMRVLFGEQWCDLISQDHHAVSADRFTATSCQMHSLEAERRYWNGANSVN